MVQAIRPAAGACDERILRGLVSRHEEPLLAWLARHVPFRIAPDHLTLLGVAGATLTAAALVASNLSADFLWLALAGLALNWLGDSLDGTLARLRRIERSRYGFYVDHLADTASQVLIAIGLGLSPGLRLDVACLALAAYLLLSVFTLVRLNVFRSMQLTYFGIGPTEVRLLLAAGMLMAAVTEVPWIMTPVGRFTIFDAATLVVVLLAVGSAAAMFARDLARLSALDPPCVPVEVSMIEIPETDTSRAAVLLTVAADADGDVANMRRSGY